MQINDRVNWQYKPRGGYGYVIPVAAVVISLTEHKARIRVAQKVTGEWKATERNVVQSSLSPRETVCPELGE